MAIGTRVPQQQDYFQAINFLTQEQFPVILQSSIEYFATITQTGIYRHFNQAVRSFMDQLTRVNGRQFTLSGVGSFIDTDKYGHQIKRPSPQTVLSGCAGDSLCFEPTCFGFTEGVIESNNVLEDICWSLNMPCLKDQLYSDTNFSFKMQEWFRMFFRQPAAVAEAWQRTKLFREAYKVVATNKSIRFTGTSFGAGMPLPFYINTNDPLSMPNITNIGNGITIGGFNLHAFATKLAPRLFSQSFVGGMKTVKIYGLEQDWMTAKAQTNSVMDTYMQQDIARALNAPGYMVTDPIASLLGEGFQHDGQFPTFNLDADGFLELIPQEILEPSTIAGYVQTDNPAHPIAPYRALLFVPSNWRFNLVEPPQDDFSYLGLGNALNFRTNTPGVTPLLSSGLFAGSEIAPDGVVVLGTTPMGGMAVSGVQRRPEALTEAIRTEVVLTYSDETCANFAGQLDIVGPPRVRQKQADGFALKSTAYFGTDVKGTARPVLVFFKDDQLRAPKAIEVCDFVEIDLVASGDPSIVSCCPNGTSLTLGYSVDVSDTFAEGDSALYRAGGHGNSYLVTVDAVSTDGKLVTISSDTDTILPCCSSSPDDYGVRGELITLEGITADSSEIFKAEYVLADDELQIELYDPTVAAGDNTPMTITLSDGTVIDVLVKGAKDAGVFVTVDTVGLVDPYDLSTLDCSCLNGAVFGPPAASE